MLATVCSKRRQQGRLLSTKMTVVSRADAVNLAESSMRVFDMVRIHNG